MATMMGRQWSRRTSGTRNSFEGIHMAKKPKALVLGVGALRGIGGAASRRFAKEGYHVLVAGRTPQKIEAVVDAIRQDGGSAMAYTIDGTREDEVIRLFDLAMGD